MQLNIFSAVHHDNISFGATVAASVLRDQNIQYLRVETHRKAIQSSEITYTSYSNTSVQIKCINNNEKKNVLFISHLHKQSALTDKAKSGHSGGNKTTESQTEARPDGGKEQRRMSV